MVEHGHVGVGVVEVIGVWRIVLLSPVTWQRTVQVEDVVLGFGLVVHAVESHHLGQTQKNKTKKRASVSVTSLTRWADSMSGGTDVFQEEVELRVAARVHAGLKQRHEDVLQHLLEVSELLLGAVNVTGRP